MTADLRDQLAAFEAAAQRILQGPRPHLALVHARPARCHPGRPVNARGLCRSCYEIAWRNGTLDRHPPVRTLRSRADFIADYQLLRSEGHTHAQIAERLGMKITAVRAAYYRAVRDGELTRDRRPA